jgi:hypothetical protein
MSRDRAMIKATIFLITTLINVGIGAVLLFMLVISLNGFTEDQAAPGLILFIVWVLLFSHLAGILSFLSAQFLMEKKSFSAWLAALSAIAVFSIIGATVNFVGMIIAVSVTSAMR